MEIKGMVACFKCDSEFSLNETNSICDSCLEKLDSPDIEEAKCILNYLFKEGKMNLDGSSLVGFKSEEEKNVFLMGLKQGIIDSTFHFMDYYGDDLINTWEVLREDFIKAPIKVNYDAEVEKKYSCNKENS